MFRPTESRKRSAREATPPFVNLAPVMQHPDSSPSVLRRVNGKTGEIEGPRLRPMSFTDSVNVYAAHNGTGALLQSQDEE